MDGLLYCLDQAISYTYFWILLDEFGRDCSWYLCHTHTPIPPTAFQSSSELLFGGVCPNAGGLSGNFCMNSLRAILNNSKDDWQFTFFGKMFQSVTAFTPNELSEAVDTEVWALFCSQRRVFWLSHKDEGKHRIPY